MIPIIAVPAGWEPFSLGIGSRTIVEYTADESTLFSISFGSDLFILSILAGVLNGLGAVYFSSRFSPFHRESQ
jgi:hypothetical protein